MIGGGNRKRKALEWGAFRLIIKNRRNILRHTSKTHVGGGTRPATREMTLKSQVLAKSDPIKKKKELANHRGNTEKGGKRK